MNNLRSSLFLLVLVALGGAYIYWAERGPASSPDAVVLLRAPLKEIQRVTLLPANVIIERQGSGDTFMVRDGKTGLLAPLDADAGQSLWSQLALVQSPSPVPNPEKLAQYGLQPPKASIAVDDQKIELGEVAPFDKTFVYARGNGHVALINMPLLETTKKTFLEWRDRTILKSADLASFSLRGAQGSLDFKKDETGLWMLNVPRQGILNAYADNDAIQGTLGALESAKIVKWRDETGKNPVAYALNHPRAVFEAGNASLQVGKKMGDGYAARWGGAGAIFEIPGVLEGLLNRPLNEWRDKKIAHFALGAATRLEVEQGNKQKNLVKNGNDWQLETGQSDSQTTHAALDLLAFALDLRATDFVDTPAEKAKFKTVKPLLTLKIGAEQTTELRFARVGNALWVERQIGKNVSGMIFVLDSHVLDATHDATSQFFERPKL